MTKYRLYTFVNNVYMSPIQWGIQTAHVVSSMMVKYHQSERTDVFNNWAAISPTIIVCKGGILSTLQEIEQKIDFLGNSFNLAHASFCEDDESLGGILTCVGILVPEEIYEAKLCVNSDSQFASNFPLMRNHAITKSGRFVYKETDPDYFQLIELIVTAKTA